MRKKRFLVPLACILLLALALAARRLHRANPSAEADDAAEARHEQQERQLLVELTPVEKRRFEDAVVVQGSVEAKHYADVPARAFGALDAVFVDEGDVVKKDETRLFQVDRENLARAVLVAEQDLAVARCGQRESEANLERVQADLKKADLDYARYQRLREREAVSQHDLERQESIFNQATAQRKHAVAMVDLAKERVTQAEVALEIARKNLSDSVVLAPFDGLVTHRIAEPGEIAEPGKTVMRIEDVTVLEVAAFLPAQHYAAVVPDITQMRVRVAGIDAGTHPIDHKSPVIDAKRRTFEIRCLLEGPQPGIAPGALAEVAVVLESCEALGVPNDAVQIRDDHSVVFVADQGRATMVPIETGLTTDGWTEVPNGTLVEGTPVVTTGQYMLNDGSPVSVKKETI